MSQAEVYTKYCRKWHNQGRMVKCNIQVCDRTIRNQINATGIKYVMLEKKKKHRKEHLKWGKSQVYLPLNKLNKIVFYDEWKIRGNK